MARVSARLHRRPAREWEDRATSRGVLKVKYAVNCSKLTLLPTDHIADGPLQCTRMRVLRESRYRRGERFKSCDLFLSCAAWRQERRRRLPCVTRARQELARQVQVALAPCRYSREPLTRRNGFSGFLRCGSNTRKPHGIPVRLRPGVLPLAKQHVFARFSGVA